MGGDEFCKGSQERWLFDLLCFSWYSSIPKLELEHLGWVYALIKKN